MVDTQMKSISKSKQCELLSISRSRLYYKPVGESAINFELMEIIDKVIYDRPFYGIRRMTPHLICMGYKVNVKRIRRLFRLWISGPFILARIHQSLVKDIRFTLIYLEV
jgi:putative transposase